MSRGVQPTLLLCKDKEHCRAISYKEKGMCGSVFRMELLRKFSALILFLIAPDALRNYESGLFDV